MGETTKEREILSTFTLQAFNRGRTMAGVFEDDGSTGYFYLYDPNASESGRIIDSMQIYISSEARVHEENILVVWSADESKVGIKIERVIWGVYDVKNQRKYQHMFKRGSDPGFANEVLEGLM